MIPVDLTSPLRSQLDRTIQAISGRTRLRPRIGVIVGSGLGGVVGALQVEASIDYAELPHMPQATAPGHEGKLVLGTLSGQRLAVLAGRFHFYEGYSMAQVTYPIRLLQALGAEIVILTSIVGSMNRQMPSGSLVLLEDHINLMGANPLLGPNDDTFGPRFPDMSQPYDPALRQLALAVAAERHLPLREGVYVAVAGPNLETRAEYRFLRQIGADVVGMSMVPEVLVARHGGQRVLAVTVVSDACIPEELKPASVEELLRVAAETEPKLTALLQGVIERL
ncbi:MAG: purine-nucleoside phosphorylase [Candidatus Omnitrophica bacterium CG11_big_fil_rev_8_21_14_0_20_63_9]|nr:MAG: purine-nucleoside phosphorylase [Candidatus Omnitrophica bacterium CG11_big_fil_rev_8_21_14_0_20_63_9]